jgi:hypothetical protein
MAAGREPPRRAVLTPLRGALRNVASRIRTFVRTRYVKETEWSWY